MWRISVVAAMLGAAVAWPKKRSTVGQQFRWIAPDDGDAMAFYDAEEKRGHAELTRGGQRAGSAAQRELGAPRFPFHIIAICPKMSGGLLSDPYGRPCLPAMSGMIATTTVDRQD